MDNEILSRLHNVELEILKTVHKICIEHQLTYYLWAGSLLGAVRHKGFIPWDDDIDIIMPREDYEEFAKLCKEGVLGEDYSFQDISTYSNYHLFFGKVRKNNTLFDEPAFQNQNCNKGIYIDIYPMDYCKKKGGILFHLRGKLVKAFSHLVMVRALDLRTASVGNKMLFCITRPLTVRAIAKIRDKIASCGKKESAEFLTSYGSEFDYMKSTTPADWWGGWVPDIMEFEGENFFVPREWDKVLTAEFGDYMTLPPIEERRTHTPKKIIFEQGK